MLVGDSNAVQIVKNKTVAELILDYLKLEGVRFVFGIPGGGLKQLLEALRVQPRD